MLEEPANDPKEGRKGKQQRAYILQKSNQVGAEARRDAVRSGCSNSWDFLW
jgi:hypothetical protein